MSEMVERVARALHASFLKDWAESDQIPWDELAPWHREYGLKQARAAIEAMREPDNRMKCSGATQLRREVRKLGNGNPLPSDAASCFRAMIDAALVSRETS